MCCTKWLVGVGRESVDKALVDLQVVDLVRLQVPDATRAPLARSSRSATRDKSN